MSDCSHSTVWSTAGSKSVCADCGKVINTDEVQDL